MNIVQEVSVLKMGGFRGSRLPGDPVGGMLILLAFVLAGAGFIMVYRSYPSWRDAYDTTSRNFALYTLLIGSVLCVAAVVLGIWGASSQMAWLEDEGRSGSIYRSYGDPDPPLSIFGYQLEYSGRQYWNSFDNGGLPSWFLTALIAFGIYAAWGSAGAILRKDFAIYSSESFVRGMIAGVVIAIAAMMLLYRYLNFVADIFY